MAPPGGLDALAASVLERAEFPDGPLLVALSGGADSAVLAWAARQSARAVRAVFVDHRLAGSADLSAAAQAVAEHLELEFDTVSAPVDSGASNLEDRARTVRYEELRAAAKPDEWIVTGHTADDQAETVLGNVLRGAGTAGLAGIPRRRPPIARPLLTVTRAETRTLAAGLGLPFFDDPANVDPAFRRNRLRRSLIPRLEAEFNPGLRTALLRTAELASADEAALEAAARRVPIRFDGEVVSVAAPAVTVLPTSIAGRVVRRALRLARGPHAGSFDEVEAVLGVAGRTRRAAELGGGWRAEREGPLVVLAPPPPPAAQPVPVEIPGDVEFDRWRLELGVSADPPPYLAGPTQVADADAVGPELLVRPAGGGERIDIGTGTKTVGDALAEAGVPKRLRHRRPVLEARGRIAMIPGVRTAAWAWREPGTTRYLVARISVIGPEGT